MADMELQLKLSADGSGLTGTLRTASGELRQFSVEADAAGKRTSRSLGDAEKSTSNLGKAIGGFVAAAAGAFALLVKSQVDLADEIGSTAKRLGVTTEALSAMGALARRNGSDLKAMTSGLESLGDAAVSAGVKGAAGGKQAAGAFAALNISVRDAAGQLKPTTELMGEVATGLAKLPEGAYKSELATKLLGSAGRDLNGTLNELAQQGLQNVIDKARETGEVVTSEGAARAKEFNDALQDLKTKASSFASSVAQDVLPTLLALFETLGDDTRAAKDAGEETRNFRALMEVLGLSVVVSTEAFRTLFTILFGGIDILIGIAKATGETVAGIFNAIRAIEAFKTGNVQAASAFAGQAKSAFTEGWKEISTSASRAWMNITSQGADSGAKIAEYTQRIADGYKKVGNAAQQASGDATAAAADQAKAAAEQEAAIKRQEAALAAKAAADRKAEQAAKASADAAAAYVARLQDQVATFGLTEAALERYRVAHMDLTPAQRESALAAIAQKEALDAAKKASDEAASALASLQGMAGNQAENLEDLRARLNGANAAQIAYNRTMRDAQKAFKAAGAEASKAAVEALNAAQKTAEAIRDLAPVLDADAIAQEANTTPYDGMLEQLDALKEAIRLVGDETSEAFDPKRLKAYEDAQERINANLQDRNIALLQQGVSSLQTFAKEGTAAYTALGIAQDILAYKSAITAIANQGGGDPYTAFARIAAMIAMMASIGIRVAGSGGGFSDTAAQRQATQGTGSVLGDSEAKSESIANAVEITADATTELVGINRGMLSALQSLEAGLGGASNMLARGAGEVDFGKFDPGFMLNSGNGAAMGAAIGTAVMPVIGTIVGAVLGAVLGSVLGGSSRLTDQGIAISGGSVTDAQFSAYQEHQVRSWRFGSRRTIEQTAALPDDVANQFQLVMDSIVDTVREGALALGILPEEIQAAIDAYRIEEIRISLKDLSAEEQQKELEAVFSQIFDGLAGSVVPFIEQFQQVGEGLGETLVRVATGVQVTQEAMRQLGLVIETTDPETFAQISEGIIAAVGGLDEYISGIQNFASNFASESQQFKAASDALTSAFAQVGLVVPDTRAAMFALMQTLDATTAEGQEQIATLLRLSDVAGAYYDMLEEQVKEAAEYLTEIGLGSLVESSFASRLAEIRASEQKAIDAANTLAIAHGREGASAIELARIHQWTASQIAAAIRRLQAETQDLIAQLYGGIPGTLEGVNAQIAALEQQSGTAFNGIANDSANLFESWRAGIQSVQDYLDSMLLGDLSGLTPEEQLAEARRQLEEAQQAALGGDANALNQLPQLADAYLRLLRGFEASGSDYGAGFDWVRDLLQQVTGVAGPAAGSPTTTVQVTASAELQALYAQRDAMLAQQEAEHRRILAEQLAQNLHDLAVLLNTPILEMITLQGVSLQQLAIDLGVNLQDLTASSVQALGSMAATLGVSLGELTGSLGLTLSDLSAGLAELTGQVGIDLTNLTVESTQTLALLASSLGADLSDLATSLGLSLGALADQQSLLNQALAAEINSLPAEQSAALAPLLEAISAATTEADANTAIQALEDAVNLLAPDIRTQLAPYLADVFPADALSDLDYLGEIQSIAQDQLGVLGQINEAIRASNGAQGVPGYAVGTGYVPNTGLALIHQGEGIIPAPINAWLRTNGYPTGGGDSPAVLQRLAEISERIDRMDKNNVAATRETTQVVDQTGQRSDRNRERVAAESGPRQRSAAYG